jgi:hypothetical protein
MTPLEMEKKRARMIAQITELLTRNYPLWEDSGFPPDGWEDEVDSESSLSENIGDLEKRYSITLRAPEESPRPDKPVRSKNEECGVGPDGEYDKMEAKVIVKPHTTRAKGKLYTCGRIQLTVDKRYIGTEAEVRIFIKGSGGIRESPVKKKFGPGSVSHFGFGKKTEGVYTELAHILRSDEPQPRRWGKRARTSNNDNQERIG